jgi:aminoglycoside phosphotransferase (APT) family kinase protein
MPWARLGGVAADIAWADRELSRLAQRRTGPVEQIKSWNLSLLLRMPTTDGTVWLKHVPPFMRHEAAVMRLVRQADASVPEVLASDLVGRALLKEIPGADAYHPDEPLAIQMVESFVALQERLVSRRDAILAAGGQDWTRATLLREASRLAARDDLRADLELSEQAALDRLVSEIPARLEALYECGLVDTLVHGDFHPGNYRTDGQRLVLLDWGDSGVGHPLLDRTTFLNGVPTDWLTRVRDAWNAKWKALHPTADVWRAAELVRPIAALRLASVYQRFLDGIEASEHVYHRTDPPAWLRHAITLARNR